MLLFFLRFIGLYLLLLVLGTLLREPARAYLQGLAETFNGGRNDSLELAFRPVSVPGHPDLLRIVIGDRVRMTRNDSGPVRNLDLDPVDLIVGPQALFSALILCTPISWRRRLAALFWGALWQQVVVLLVVAFFIWSESSQLSLMPPPRIEQLATEAIRQMITTQLGLAVPILLWIAVVFRREDIAFLDPGFARLKIMPGSF